MQSSVSERIADMVQHFTKGNKSAFAKAVGISNQSLGEIVGSRQSAPSFAALQKILAAFPEVRIEWLVNGDGPQLKSEALSGPQWAKNTPPSHRPKLPDGGEVYDGYIGNYPILSPRNGETIPIVTLRDTRKYSERNGPPVLPKDLARYESEAYESISMPVSLLLNGKHIAISVGSNCMEPTLRENDFVICGYVEKAKWVAVNKNALCALWSKKGHLYIGRVAFDYEKQKAYCRFDNIDWVPVELDINDVEEVWSFKWKLSNSARNMADMVQHKSDVEGTTEVIRDLQKNIEILNQRVNKTFSGFRENIRGFMAALLIQKEDIDKVDFVKLSNNERVRDFYVSEHGPVTDNDKYVVEAVRTMQSVAFEITLDIQYSEVNSTE